MHEPQKRIYGMSLWKILGPSVLGILLCVACLAGSVWAWFICDQSADVAEIQAASFQVNTTVMEKPGNTTVNPEDGVYVLQAGPEYTVTLQRTAESTATGGYVEVTIGGANYYTRVFSQTYSFTITVEEENTLACQASWGTLPEGQIVENEANLNRAGTQQEPQDGENEALKPQPGNESPNGITETVPGTTEPTEETQAPTVSGPEDTEESTEETQASTVSEPEDAEEPTEETQASTVSGPKDAEEPTEEAQTSTDR